MDDFAQKDPMPLDSSESDADIHDHVAKDFNGLADMYWVRSFLCSSFFPVSKSVASFLLFRFACRKRQFGGSLSLGVITNIFLILQTSLHFKLSSKIQNSEFMNFKSLNCCNY